MSGARSRKLWSAEEDALLRSLVERYGDARGSQSKWKVVADKIPGRTTKDCRKRWFHSLDPNVRKGRWTADEDQILKQAYQELGPAWHIIASMIRGRKDDYRETPQSEMTTPQNTDTPNRVEDFSIVMALGSPMHENNTTTVVSVDPANIFSAAREFDDIDEWWENPFLLSTSPWLNTTEPLDSPRRQEPQQPAQTRQSERIQNRQSRIATALSPARAAAAQLPNANSGSAMEGLPQACAPVDIARPPSEAAPAHATTNLDHKQRTLEIEFDNSSNAVTEARSILTVPSSTESSTDSSVESLSTMSFPYEMARVVTERSIAGQQPLPPPGLQLQFSPPGVEPLVGSQNDERAQTQRQESVLQSEQIAEIERESQQMLGTTLSANGTQHIFHHYHHHHHHYYHHYYHPGGQT
ncbi:myb-like dna-binding protein bas1 [Ophiostoma piceae UAMH 11346]|uniref:Myb-like dna-binding protein bas1 n=1 Tax=Ophiostoma piceae (strain UAMH 11346) TaxID=1262450 RepID=S3CZX9_OPHP1|nr:myb-like dna-binding protein bas1 [Ophiostoma piceae UAMH 11346]